MIIFSLWSRFNTRKGSASTKGTKQRLDKLGVLYWQTDTGPIMYGFCKTREEYEHIKRTLSIYSGCKFPMVVESADGSFTCRRSEHKDGTIVKTKERVSDEVILKIQGQL